MSNTGTRTVHEPTDACDECLLALMDVAMAEYDAGLWAPIEDVFAIVEESMTRKDAN